MICKNSLVGPGRLLAALFFILLTGCNKETVKSQSPAAKLEPTLESVQATFVNARCVSCHMEATAGNRQVKLTDIREVIEKPHVHGGGPHPRYLIKPGCPKQSFFLTILKEGKMPPRPAERVSAEELKTIEAFIMSLDPKAGKLCDDEPPDLEEF